MSKRFCTMMLTSLVAGAAVPAVAQTATDTVMAGGARVFAGESLLPSENGTRLFVSGEKSGIAGVTTLDVKQTNYVTHDINSVLPPN